jgi:hypothetical protein
MVPRDNNIYSKSVLNLFYAIVVYIVNILYLISQRIVDTILLSEKVNIYFREKHVYFNDIKFDNLDLLF